MSKRFVVLLALAGALVACGDDDSPADGGPVDVVDASVDAGATDAGVGDAGRAEDDAGAGEPDGGADLDAGVDEGGFDGGGPDDGGSDDAGVSDAGVSDAGSPDAGPPDSGVMLPNVVENGSFELWEGNQAVGWHGAQSNTSSESVWPSTEAAHDGVRSARLVNTTGSHKRFTTAPTTWVRGRYQCTYWVQGEGEIRNAFYNTDFSAYSSYTSVSSTSWREISYSFNLASTATAFELIFSFRNTSEAGLLVDDVRCTRMPEPCDGAMCEEWQTCVRETGECVAATDRCGDDGDCPEHRACDLGTHTCELRDGRCDTSIDCGDPELRCDTAARTCVPGDACTGVTCAEWRTCNPTTVMCELTPGRCERHADCGPGTPVCDVSTHQCVAAESSINVVPNGSFERWEEVTIGSGSTFYLLPERWYGLADGMGYIPDSEIRPQDVRQSTASPYDGSYAVQLVRTGAAERFTTERFAVQPTRTYDCAYRVRGRGSIRHRAYCGGWNPDTEFESIDSTEWQTISFSMSGSASSCVLVFYPSYTVAEAGHLELDGVVCTAR